MMLYFWFHIRVYLQNHGALDQATNWWLGLGYSGEDLGNLGFVGDVAGIDGDCHTLDSKLVYCILGRLS